MENKINQDFIDRLQKLAGIKKVNEEDESNKQITSNLEFLKRGADGITYGVIKENTNYFIKKSTSNVETLNESDFVYIGGLANKNKYRYPSYADALKNLNMMFINLNEAFSITESEEKNDEVISENKEKDEKKEEVKENEIGGEEEIQADTIAPEQVSAEIAPETEISSDPIAEPSVEAPVDQSSQEEVPTPEDSLDSADDSDLDDEDPVKEIQSMLGKLTQKIRSTELTADTTKSILNSTISSLNLQLISPEERLVIAKRVKKGEEAVDEEIKTENVNRLKTLIEEKLKAKKQALASKMSNGFQVMNAKEKTANTKKFEPKTNSNKIQNKKFIAKNSGKLTTKASKMNEGYNRLEKLIDKVIAKNQ